MTKVKGEIILSGSGRDLILYTPISRLIAKYGDSKLVDHFK